MSPLVLTFGLAIPIASLVPGGMARSSGIAHTFGFVTGPASTISLGAKGGFSRFRLSMRFFSASAAVLFEGVWATTAALRKKKQQIAFLIGRF